MKKIKILFTAVILFTANYSYGQIHIRTEELNANNVKASFSNVGSNFWDFLGRAKYEMPSGSDKHTLYVNTLWIGGKDENGQLHLASELYRVDRDGYSPGPLMFDGEGVGHTNAGLSSEWNLIWKISKDEIEEFTERFTGNNMEGYEIPSVILGWPAHGDVEAGLLGNIAPFVDVNGDGKYNPAEDRDYPLIKGDQALFFVFNDIYMTTPPSGGEKMGVEIYGMAYAYASSEAAFNNTVYLEYQIVNRSSNTYYDTYIGLFTDIDIGNPKDDYIGCDVGRSCYFGYNGDDYDESADGYTGYGEVLPAQAVVFLKGAPKDDDGLDNATSYNRLNILDCLLGDIFNGNINGSNFEDGIVDNERWGMTGFVSINNFTGGNENTYDPQTAQQYYNYMTGKWLDNTPISYGGTGHYSGGADLEHPAKFMFPGTSDVCGWGTGGVNMPEWSEATVDNAPGDRRGLGITGPFTFTPGMKVDIEVAFVTGFPDQSHVNPVEVMLEYVDIIRDEYSSRQPQTSSNIVEADPNNINLYPNPANERVSLSINGEEYGRATIEVYDLQGKTYMTEKTVINGNLFEYEINTSSLPEGIYFVSVKTGKSVSFKKLVILK